MLEALKRRVLRFARVPAEPHAPFGSPGSIRVFRAADNYWKYLLVTWGLKQISGAAALVFFLSLSSTWLAAVERTPPPPGPAAETRPAPPIEGERAPEGRRARSPRNRPPLSLAAQRRLAGLVHGLELFGLGVFIIQLPFSLAAARLNYEMRWYVVTDRSLRLREGIFGVKEMTLTFANVQNITIRQGPLQRLLGISDVVVQTAGGGGGESGGHPAHGAGESLHTGVLRAVDDAASVRDLILERLRRFRDAGLGDPDDRHRAAPAPAVAGDAALRDAARELLDAARALR